MDFVFSSHLLEHIQDYRTALKEWWRIIRPGGHLCLYLPHKDFYPNIGQPGANPDHKHDFLPSDIIEAMKEVGYWDLLENQERNEGDEYSFFQVYKKLPQKTHLYSCKAPKPEKTCAVVRYGGIGDMIQTASIFPLLKRDGYHVTVFTNPIGYEVLRADPNVDNIIVQDADQVPNGELWAFWEYWRGKFTKWVNFSESTEGTLLSIPGRVNHAWPDSFRRKVLNRNYLEFMHDMAEVPHEFNPRFYATPEEKEKAKREKNKLGGYVIAWVLSGSSVHKGWPWVDQIIARILVTYPHAKIVTMGDATCQILEGGWEKEPRVVKRSGKWEIRESLAFVEQADLVIGPETGLLNAVSHLALPKILFLSHSSVENLSRDWVSTTNLVPPHTPCYPCHRLHYNWDYCFRVEESGAALCQDNIHPDVVWDAITKVMEHGNQRVS